MSEKPKVHIHYDAKTDYLEVSSHRGEVVATDIGDGIFELRAKGTRGKVVGHAVTDASSRIGDLSFLDPFVKFAVQVKVARLKRGFTQSKLAKRMGIGLLPYQRLESGGNNPTLKTILKLKEMLPEISLDRVLV
jgi:DNA-binding XRE family transcriptional regulator